MRNSYKFFALGLIPLMGLSLISCSDNDEPKVDEVKAPTTENVFPDGLPSNVDGANFTTNEKGQLTKIVDGYSTVTFEYGSFTPTRAHNFTVLMKNRNSESPYYGSDIYLELNKQGFVSYAYQVYLDEDLDDDEWWFEYNNDGRLTRLKRTESGDDFKITYTNEDITKVVQDDERGCHDEWTFSYTNEEYKNVVPNKGCLMLYDDFFCVDMDEMGSAYFAGLLGKPTKNLPMGYVVNGSEEGFTYTRERTYHWVFNGNDLPTKFWTSNDDYNTEAEALTFAW